MMTFLIVICLALMANGLLALLHTKRERDRAARFTDGYRPRPGPAHPAAPIGRSGVSPARVERYTAPEHLYLVADPEPDATELPVITVHPSTPDEQADRTLNVSYEMPAPVHSEPSHSHSHDSSSSYHGGSSGFDGGGSDGGGSNGGCD